MMTLLRKMYAYVQAGRPELVEGLTEFYGGLMNGDESYETSGRGASFMRSKNNRMQGGNLGVSIWKTTSVSIQALWCT